MLLHGVVVPLIWVLLRVWAMQRNRVLLLLVKECVLGDERGLDRHQILQVTRL